MAKGQQAVTQIRAVVSGWRDYDCPARIAAWDKLAQKAGEPNPFYESWFLLPALRAFDPHYSVQIFALECEGEVVGLLPVRRELSYYGRPIPHLRGWTHDNCFLGAPLVMPGYEKLFWIELFRWADEHCGIALFLHLAHMPSKGRLHEALSAHVQDERRPAAAVMQEERALLQSALTPEDYFENSLSTKKRKELRRQERRLAEEGELTFERQSDGEEIAEWCEEFMQLEAKGWKGQNGSATAANKRTRETFMQALAGAADRGRLERLTLRLDGRAIAMLVNYVTPPGAFSFKTTFDESYARFSPGVQLQRENLQILQDTRVNWIDSCAASDHPMIDHFWRERRTISRYSFGLGGVLRRQIFKSIVRLETGAMSGGI